MTCPKEVSPLCKCCVCQHRVLELRQGRAGIRLCLLWPSPEQDPTAQTQGVLLCPSLTSQPWLLLSFTSLGPFSNCCHCSMTKCASLAGVPLQRSLRQNVCTHWHGTSSTGMKSFIKVTRAFGYWRFISCHVHRVAINTDLKYCTGLFVLSVLFHPSLPFFLPHFLPFWAGQMSPFSSGFFPLFTHFVLSFTSFPSICAFFFAPLLPLSLVCFSSPCLILPLYLNPGKKQIIYEGL